MSDTLLERMKLDIDGMFEAPDLAEPVIYLRGETGESQELRGFFLVRGVNLDDPHAPVADSSPTVTVTLSSLAWLGGWEEIDTRRDQLSIRGAKYRILEPVPSGCVVTLRLQALSDATASTLLAGLARGAA